MNNYSTNNYRTNNINYQNRNIACQTRSAIYPGRKHLTVEKIIYIILKLLEKVLMSDAFAATFCGISFILVVGIVGGVECGRLSLTSGMCFSSILLGVVSVLLYKKNRE